MARYSFVLQRRTSLWIRCGVSLFLILTALNCTPGTPATSSLQDDDDTLLIGAPENTGTGADIGVSQVARFLSVDGLAQLTTDGRATPRLASGWQWENNRRLRVTLQPGVTFHDGSPLTAKLTAETLASAIARPANRALYPSLNYVTAVEPAGEHAVVLELSQPSAFLPEDLEIPLELRSPSRGTGPFRIVSEDSKEVVLERFENYRGGRASIRRVVIRPFETLRTAWTSLLRGDVDMVTDVPPDAVEFIRNDVVEVISFSRRYQVLIAFNSSKAPFTSAAVRRALNLAVDRQALLAKVFQGQGLPSTGPLWPQYWAYDTSIAPFPYDPALAISLLKGAGFQPGDGAVAGGVPNARLRFTCVIPDGFSIWERVALEVQKYLYNIGVDMQFKVVPFQEFDSLMREGRFDAALSDLISGPTPGRASIFWQSARDTKGLNVFGYENREAERLFELLRTDTNEAAVRSATRRLQSVFLDDPPALFLAWTERARAVRRDFRIVQDSNRDPLLSLWRWTADTVTNGASSQ